MGQWGIAVGGFKERRLAGHVLTAVARTARRIGVFTNIYIETDGISHDDMSTLS